MRLASIITFAFIPIGVAACAIVACGPPPGTLVHPDMRVTYQAHTVGIYTHIFASAVALVGHRTPCDRSHFRMRQAC